jgi:PAS domain S-box-containing protein
MPSRKLPPSETDASPNKEPKDPILFAGNPLPMWVHDSESLRFLEVNESAEHQYGYSREEFLSLTLNDIRLQQDDSETVQTNCIDPGNVHLKKDGTQIM